MNEIVRTEQAGIMSRTAWSPPDEMTFDSWCEMGRQLLAMHESVNWWLGDWLNEGEKRYGETYAQAIEITGHRQDHLVKCKQVARGVQKWTRVQDLSWTHHRYVADLDEDAQRELLGLALEHKLPSRDLMAAVKTYRANLRLGQIEAREQPEVRDVIVEDDDSGDETYTPEMIVEKVRETLSFIELDPASSAEAQQVVQAERYFTKEDDGMSKRWSGRVFLHPPPSLVNEMVGKLRREFDDGHVDEAIVLVAGKTSAVWFQELLGSYQACFLFGKLWVWGPGADSLHSRSGYVVFYMGKFPEFFAGNFRHLGVIARAI